MKKLQFIFEMANNHMGDINHGLKIIDELRKISSNFKEFDFAVKLQYRDDSFFILITLIEKIISSLRDLLKQD